MKFKIYSRQISNLSTSRVAIDKSDSQIRQPWTFFESKEQTCILLDIPCQKQETALLRSAFDEIGVSGRNQCEDSFKS